MRDSWSKSTVDLGGAPSSAVVVVGGGILGLAVARELRRRELARTVVLLEKEPELARHQTGHNSGVVHTGIYYVPGSAKARLCVAGAELMREYCREQSLPLAVRGKLVVATEDDELSRLEELHRRGVANGVAGLEIVGPDRMREIEPAVAGLKALWVPGAAVCDYRRVAAALATEVRERGVDVRTGVLVKKVAADGDGVVVVTTAGTLRAGRAIACAGLHSDRLARDAGVDVRVVPFRGEYFALRPERSELVRGLVYPVPDPRLPFLGVHLTRGVDDVVHAGPNAVLAWHREGYRRGQVSWRDGWEIVGYPGTWRLARRHFRAGWMEWRRSWSKARFVRDLQRLVPGVRADDLVRCPAGVRAQAVARDGALVDDFVVVRDGAVVHVCNAPSPAATAALAIAAEVVGE